MGSVGEDMAQMSRAVRAATSVRTMPWLLSLIWVKAGSVPASCRI